MALAPELFVHQGDASKYPGIAELIKEVISKVPDAQVMSDLDAVVAWYGKLSGTPNALSPQNPLDIATTSQVPVLGLYGANYAGILLESVEQMKLELSKGKSKSEFMVFANSGHAFYTDYRPSYVEADAKKGWQRCLAWFKKQLG
jgi:carboxymethylenebutenolidase